MKNPKAKNKEPASHPAVAFTDHGWEDYQSMLADAPKLVPKINDLIDACIADPFTGIGKPEPLKGNVTGLWSRRIDRQHRLVYAVIDDTIHVVACRYHY
jgi:toxin YoeB